MAKSWDMQGTNPQNTKPPKVQRDCCLVGLTVRTPVKSDLRNKDTKGRAHTLELKINKSTLKKSEFYNYEG